ncbi:HAD-IA family hydrolase [bacterium]|nr:HAD-IA family hydrolase [bacterium]
MGKRKFEAVFFDAHDTIIHLSHEPADIYYLVGKEFGGSASIEEYRRVYDSLRDEWFSHPMRLNAIQSKDPSKRKEWWRLFVQAVYKGVGLEKVIDEHFEKVYSAFIGNQYWRVFDDVIETLDTLKRIGIKLGVISNWDTRLITILKDLNLYDKFDQVTISSQVGYEKPAPEIFKAAARNMEIPIKLSIFVGDSPEKDVIAANNAGMKGILISRDGFNFPDLDSICSLNELIDYVEQES